jgi:HSP20 family protein
MRPWDPFREFEDLRGQMGRLMDSVFGRVDGETSAWSPLGDVSETADAYLVELDVPGVRREDIDVEMMGNELVITGELKEKERDGRFHHRTRRFGRFGYRTTLPRQVDADKIEATMDNGVLTVRIPKSESVKPRRIEITGG